MLKGSGKTVGGRRKRVRRLLEILMVAIRGGEGGSRRSTKSEVQSTHGGGEERGEEGSAVCMGTWRGGWGRYSRNSKLYLTI